MDTQRAPVVPASEPARSLLVVDDDPFIVRLLEIELTAAGFELRTASNGPRALELALERCPELVVADVRMPTVDGFELTRRLRLDDRTAATKLIVLSARGQSTDRLEGFAVGADGFVVKPFDPPALLERIRGCARAAGAGAAGPLSRHRRQRAPLSSRA